MNHGNTNESYRRLFKKGEDLFCYNVIERETGKLLKNIMNFVKVRQNAEDIVQDIYVDLWHRRKNFKSEHEIHNFVYSRARYFSLNFINKQKLKESRQTEFLRSLEVVSISEPMVESLNEERIRKIYHAIEQLPDYRRRVLKMSVFDEMNRTQISQKLNISPQTVSSYLYKAIEQLKTIITALVLYYVGCMNS